MTKSKEYIKEVKLYLSQDYSIETDDADKVVLTKHCDKVIWHLLIFPIFPLVANLIYRKLTKKRKIVMK